MNADIGRKIVPEKKARKGTPRKSKNQQTATVTPDKQVVPKSINGPPRALGGVEFRDITRNTLAQHVSRSMNTSSSSNSDSTTTSPMETDSTTVHEELVA